MGGCAWGEVFNHIKAIINYKYSSVNTAYMHAPDPHFHTQEEAKCIVIISLIKQCDLKTVIVVGGCAWGGVFNHIKVMFHLPKRSKKTVF